MPLAIASLIAGTLAVGMANAVVAWVGGGNVLDWLSLIVLVVLVSGWYAPSVLRWLTSSRE